MYKKLISIITMCLLPLAVQAAPTSAVFNIVSTDGSSFSVNDADIFYEFVSNGTQMPASCGEETTLPLSDFNVSLPIDVQGGTPTTFTVQFTPDMASQMNYCFQNGAYEVFIDLEVSSITANGQSKQPADGCSTEIVATADSSNPVGTLGISQDTETTFKCQGGLQATKK